MTAVFLEGILTCLASQQSRPLQSILDTGAGELTSDRSEAFGAERTLRRASQWPLKVLRERYISFTITHLMLSQVHVDAPSSNFCPFVLVRVFRPLRSPCTHLRVAQLCILSERGADEDVELMGKIGYMSCSSALSSSLTLRHCSQASFKPITEHPSLTLLQQWPLPPPSPRLWAHSTLLLPPL